ncbi:MAG: hypothetical protein HC849_17725 [Oscillatoriales cyanobacterium RU_3_3]|nr:hypothetical protein [Microcoleus sp. SU_5_6]NJL67180.1 hypothetical protein [Microcoleus sp. SM1_3_4]NJM61619.1 hypothetical protein [Oscillatoriales cyanobacterium RU_3_3]
MGASRSQESNACRSNLSAIAVLTAEKIVISKRKSGNQEVTFFQSRSDAFQNLKAAFTSSKLGQIYSC